MIILRKNNDLGAGPPKDPLLAKFTQKLRNLYIFMIPEGKLPKSSEKVISGGFRDFRSDRTPPGPMNLLVITMVWGGCGRPGARRSAFSIFHDKIMKFHENDGIPEIL